MILSIIISKNNVPIRLTQERWQHIITSHLEVDSGDYKSIMNVVTSPDLIFKGDQGELLAVKKKRRINVWIVVPYKEINQQDGFILTAYVTTDSSWLFQREIVWNKE